MITGASRGIGRAIALRCAEAGADLFLTTTNAAALEGTKAPAEAQGARVVLHCADVSQRAAVQSMVDAAVRAFDGIDILVNNAGVYKAARLVDITPEDFDRVLQVNLYGAFHVMQLVLRHMQARGHGKVVNIASAPGKWGSMSQSAYNASKHAVVGLTRCAALEMGAHGINVNAICPGFVQTDMLESFRAHADILDVPFEKVMQAGLARVPLKRFLQPRGRHDRADAAAGWRHADRGRARHRARSSRLTLAVVGSCMSERGRYRTRVAAYVAKLKFTVRYVHVVSVAAKPARSSGWRFGSAVGGVDFPAMLPTLACCITRYGRFARCVQTDAASMRTKRAARHNH